jgi:lipoprotein signal peptidase
MLRDDNTYEHTARHWPTAVWMSAAVLMVDQASKFAAGSAGCGSVICPVRNDVLFLSIRGGSAPTVLVIGFIGLAVFAGWVRVAMRRGACVPPVASAMVASGIVANLLDRVLLGSVRDFIMIPHLAVGNVADLAIVAGLVMCQFAMVTTSRRHEPRTAVSDVS